MLWGLRITSLGTLASRVLGMVRDMATTSLFGAGTTLDALVVAFRIPNLFRRLFGEGAFAAGYLPVIATRFVEDRHAAWQLFTVTLAWLSVVLAGIVVVAELSCGLIWLVAGGEPATDLLLGLAAVMLPYLFFICLLAQLAATLQALGHFTMPALAPALLNVCWLIGVWIIAPALGANERQQVYLVALCVLVSGPLQIAPLVPALRRHGARLDYNWSQNTAALRRILTATGPMMLGLAVTQINTLMDSLLAWLLAYDPATAEGRTIDWLGGAERPFDVGAASVVYIGERLYQFPLGILGLAVATAIFPLLSRHAARRDWESLSDDLTLGARLTLFLGLPASVGLMIMAEPITRLLFERGAFTGEATARTSQVIVAYGVGVWAFCASPVIVRGYYALGDHRTPVRVGCLMLVVNLILNLMLVWPLAEAGLALATSLTGIAQVVMLAGLFSRFHAHLGWRPIAITLLCTALATAAMGTVTAGVLDVLPPKEGLAFELLAVAAPIAVGIAVFIAVAWLLRRHELAMLFGLRRTRDR